MAKMIGNTVEFDLNQDVRTTYDWIVDADTPIKVIHSHGLVPGFKSYILLDVDWKHENARRRITLENGTTATEKILTIQRPTYFDYDLQDFKGSMIVKTLIKRAYGQFWLEDKQDRLTHVKWRYSFEPHNKLSMPLLLLFTKIIYRGYMQAAVSKMKRFSMEEGLRLP